MVSTGKSEVLRVEESGLERVVIVKLDRLAFITSSSSIRKRVVIVKL